MPADPLNQHMALRLDGRDDNFTRRSFVTFAERFGVPRRLTERRLDEMVRRSEPGIADLSSIGYDEKTAARLSREIRRRMDTLREGPGEEPLHPLSRAVNDS